MRLDSRRSLRRLAVFALGIGGLLSAAMAAADFRDSYKAGLDAIEARSWDDAIRHLQEAIGERAEARAVFRRYTPYYFLGIAHMGKGDCRAALEAWKSAKRQGQIQKTRDNDDLQRREKACRDTVRTIETKASEIDSLLARAQELGDGLVAIRRSPQLAPAWSSGADSFAAREKQLADLLRRAEEKSSQGVRALDQGRLTDARDLARQAAEGYERLAEDARQRLREVSAATAVALEGLEEAETAGRRLLRGIRDLQPFPSELGRRAAAVERDLERVADVKGSLRPEQLEALSQSLASSVQQLRRAARRPPRALNDAARAFLTGDYQATLELLSEQGFSNDRRARSHACLLWAAARHGLWVLGGEQDEELLEAARKQVLVCEEEESPVVPDPRFFSPRFIDFYQSALPLPEEDLGALTTDPGAVPAEAGAVPAEAEGAAPAPQEAG